MGILAAGPWWHSTARSVRASVADAPALNTPAQTPKPSADYVGTDTCATCHDSQLKNFQRTPHAVLEHDPSWKGHVTGCESCHGPGKAHVELMSEAVGNGTDPKTIKDKKIIYFGALDSTPFSVDINSRTFGGSVDYAPNARWNFSAGYTHLRVTSDAEILYFAGLPGNAVVTGRSLYFLRDNFFYFNALAELHRRVTAFASYRVNDDGGQGNRSQGDITTGLFVRSLPFTFQTPEVKLIFKPGRRVDWNVVAPEASTAAPSEKQGVEESGEGNEPRRQREVDEAARDEHQRLEVERLRELEGADRVHPQREDHAPVLRVVAQGKTLLDVTPEAEHEEQGNPPSARRPEEEREALEERQQPALRC